jgi:hypothetical protein
VHAYAVSASIQAEQNDSIENNEITIIHIRNRVKFEIYGIALDLKSNRNTLCSFGWFARGEHKWRRFRKRLCVVTAAELAQSSSAGFAWTLRVSFMMNGIGAKSVARAAMAQGASAGSVMSPLSCLPEPKRLPVARVGLVRMTPRNGVSVPTATT